MGGIGSVRGAEAFGGNIASSPHPCPHLACRQVAMPLLWLFGLAQTDSPGNATSRGILGDIDLPEPSRLDAPSPVRPETPAPWRPMVIMGAKGKTPEVFIPPAPPSRGLPRTTVVLGGRSGAPEAPLGSLVTPGGESPGADDDECPLGDVPVAQVPRNRRRLGGKDPTGSCSQGCDPDGDGKVYNVDGDYMGTVESVCPCALIRPRERQEVTPHSASSQPLTDYAPRLPPAQGVADASITATTATSRSPVI